MISPYCPIKSLQVHGFKSLQNVTITFTNPLFLVGKNGAGKSNILKALSFLSACAASSLENAFQIHGGIKAVRHKKGGGSRPSNICMRIDFTADKELWYAFAITSNSMGIVVKEEHCKIGNAYFKRNYKKISTSADISLNIEDNALCLPLLSGTEDFHTISALLKDIQIFSIAPSTLRSFQNPDMDLNAKIRLKSDGSNLTSILKSMKKDALNQLYRFLNALVPGIIKVQVVQYGDKLTLRFHQKNNENGKTVYHEAHVMSDGTMRLLGILTIFSQSNMPKIIALEEPELTIHIGALSTILTLINHFSKKTQIIITTHSSELLDYKWIEADNIRIVTWEEGKTQVHDLPAASKKSLQEHLMSPGEMMRAAQMEAT